MSISTQSTHPPTTREPTAGRHRIRLVVGLMAVGAVFALLFLGALSIVLAVPLAGLCFALAAPPEMETRAVQPTRRTFVVAVLAAATFGFVALLPSETVFLLDRLGVDGALFALAVVATISVGLPLTLAESPVLAHEERPALIWFSRRNVTLAWTGVVSLTLAHCTGSTFIALLVLGLGFPLVVGLRRVWAWRRGQVENLLWRAPWSGPARPHLFQAANHWVLLGLVAATVPTGAYDPLRGDLPGAGYPMLVAAFLGGLGLLAVLATVPLRGVRTATNLLVAASSVMLAVQLVRTYLPPADPVEIGSPVSGEWYVVQGGRAELLNGHDVAVAQDSALDILQVVDGSTHRGSAGTLDHYYAWGEPVRAPAAGVVAQVVDRFPDQKVGTVDLDHPAGNQVVLEVGDGRYLAFGHLQSSSIKVSVGQRMRPGEVIALVGNSGNTDEPHLHLQAQNSPTFDVLRPPEGLTTYPLLFDHLDVQRQGRHSHPERADLRRGDSFSQTAPLS